MSDTTIALPDFPASDDPDLDLPEGVTAPDGWEGAFRLDSDRMASWAARKRAAAEDRIREVQELAAAEVDRITAWAESQITTPARDMAFFDTVLLDYARRQREELDRKSVSTPYGTVKSKEVPATYEVTDEAAFLVWAKANRPELVQTVEKVSKVELKKRVAIDVQEVSTEDEEAPVATMSTVTDTETGEVLPGLTAVPARITYWITK